MPERYILIQSDSPVLWTEGTECGLHPWTPTHEIDCKIQINNIKCSFSEYFIKLSVYASDEINNQLHQSLPLMPCSATSHVHWLQWKQGGTDMCLVTLSHNTLLLPTNHVCQYQERILPSQQLNPSWSHITHEYLNGCSQKEKLKIKMRLDSFSIWCVFRRNL